MKLKYVQLPDEQWALVSSVKDWSIYNPESNKIWGFIHSHRRFVLRPFHKESAAAEPHPSTDQNYNLFPDGSVLVTFRTAQNLHLPYIRIMQKELGLEIENLPERD